MPDLVLVVAPRTHPTVRIEVNVGDGTVHTEWANCEGGLRAALILMGLEVARQQLMGELEYDESHDHNDPSAA